MTLLVVAGTRPEFIKLGPVVAELARRGVPFRYLHTGQHPITELGGQSAYAAVPSWPAPEILSDAWRSFAPPDAVLVQGDTWSTLTGADLAEGWCVPLIHLEAGLRCWDDSVPEERIRRAVDRRADLLLCPSGLAAKFAFIDAHEDAEIEVVGQTGLDALAQVASLTAGEVQPGRPYRSGGGTDPEALLPVGSGLAPLPAVGTEAPWVLCTLHRAEWQDAQSVLDLVTALGDAFRDVAHVIWPLHPRWGEHDAAELARHNVLVTLPWSYRTMVVSLTQAPPLLMITDSGGLLEESVPLGLPCVQVRNTTERWEQLDMLRILAPPRHGVASVVDAVRHLAALAAAAATRIERGPIALPNPTPSVRTVRAIENFLQSRSTS